MSSRGQENCRRRRTSERMRLKMLRHLDQYRITNPYRHNSSNPFPDELVKQLKKVDYLSSASISMLCFPLSSLHPPQDENNLTKMSQALEQQEAKFTSIFGQSMLDLTEVEQEPYSHSQAQPTHPSNGSTTLPPRDHLHFHMYDDDRLHLHENLFQSQALQPQVQPQMQKSNSWHQQQQSQRQINVQDFDQYFNN